MTLIAGLSGASWLVSGAYGSTASDLYKKGLRAETSGSIAQAFLYFSQAAAADPKKKLYREKAEALAPMAALEAKAKPSFLDPDDSKDAKDKKPKADLKPEDVFDSFTARDLATQRALLPAPQIELKPGVQDYDLKGDSKALFEQMAAKLGLQVVFDGDFEPGRLLHFQLSQAAPRDALHGLEAATGSFVIPMGAKLFMVAKDTEAKRKDLEQMETASVPIPSALTTQEITELGQAVKQAVGVEKIYWDTQANQLVMRDRVSRVLAAESVINDLISYRTQVAVDLEFIELDETQMREIGVDLQTSFPITFLGQVVSGTATASSVATAASNLISLAQLAKFSAGALFGVGIADVNIIATMTNAGAKNLLRTTIVSVEGQKATFHAGEKYPIITSQFVGGVATGGQVYTPTPSFTFEDLGIVVNVTPHVHDMGEVTIDLDTEYKILGANSVNGIPIISNRKLQSTMRLRSDQWALVAGLTSETTSRVVAGPAFLSYVPFLGHLISHYTGNKAKTYVIVALKPRVLSFPPSQRLTHRVYVGSETRAVTPL